LHGACTVRQYHEQLQTPLRIPETGMEYPDNLKIAYAINILILAPVCTSLLLGGGVSTVFGARVPESAGLRHMLAAMWLAIGIASGAGLFEPDAMAPVLLVQVIYKALWLLLYVAPLAARRRASQIPWGITSVFIGIVVSYPVMLWRAL
jgi:hypothetical protein